VRDVARLLATRDVAIEAEARIRVSHALLGVPGATLGAIRRVRSHPVALQQCERWFRAHPAVEPVAAFDTAGAVAEIVREGDPTVAALAAERAAELHGAVVLARELEDDPANWTRFLLLARAGEATLPPAGVPHKLALAFRAAHQPGSLWRCLGVFAERALDLTRIESHPVVGRPFEYEFMVDVVGPGDSPALDDALAALRVHCTHVRQLGRYASAPA
jgi:prephenate dehydratase